MSAVLIVALVVVTALLLLTLGFLHIVKRQRSRLPIPYGIAIAAAGLWVLGAQTLSAARMAAQSG
jgi:prepilin peptidase CpaA